MLGILQRKNILWSPFKNFFEKIIPLSYQTSFLIFVFYGLMAAAILAPISSITAIPNLGDYLSNLAAVIQAKIALSAGQFPLRVMPLEHNGWFYPLFQFYSTTTYTIAGAIYKWLTPANPLLAFKMTVWCGLVLGGVYLYRIALWFVKSRYAAILAGVIYLCAPYYIIIINQLGSLSEIVALGVVPVVLYYTLQRYYSPQNNLLLVKLGVSWYLLATIHIVTFVYAAFFIGLLLLIVSYKNPRHWRNLLSVAIAFFLGCLLAAWYLLPIALFEKYFILSNTYNNSANLQLFHPLLSQLLFSAAAITPGYKADALMTLHPSVGWPILFSAALCVYAVCHKLSSGSRRADYWMPSLLIVFFIAFLLVWSPFNVWRWLPQTLWVAQHCWRLLSQVMWIGALLSAWAICWLFKNKLDLRHVIIGTFLIMLSVNAWYPFSESADVELADFIKNPRFIYNKDAYIINFEKYTSFVDKIDNTLIEKSALLKTGVNYYIPKPLLQLAVNPAIEMQSDIPATLGDKQLHLSVYVNDVFIARQDLKTANFDWTINLSQAKNRYPDNAPLNVKFLLQDKNDNTVQTEVPLQKIFLTGYINSSETLNVNQIQKYCYQKNSMTTCDIPVGNEINFIELPALYYPKLLKISLNGKTIPYQSILFEGTLLAGIVPIAGTHNHIEMTFQGLNWANKTSWFAWFVVVFILFQQILKNFIQPRNASDCAQ